MKVPSPIDNWVSNPSETHGPLMSSACWSLGAVAFVFLAVRLFIRQSQGKLWIDDIVLGISWTFLLVQLILNQLNINLGFGKHAFDINIFHLETITYYGASALSVSVAAITLSKISFGVTLLRLTDGWLRLYVYFAIATLAIFAIPAAVLPWVLCKPITKTFMDTLPGTCIDKHPSLQYARFQAVWAALMDISLALLPWKILWKLQMRFAEKLGVCIAMSLGVLAGATALVRARYVEQLTQQDISYDATKNTIWSAAESSMTIVATSIPVLRVFFKQAVNSVIETYSNSATRSKMRTTPSSPADTLAQMSLKRSSKKPRTISKSFGGDSSVDVLSRGSQNYVKLDDLLVHEKTGRFTAASTAEPNLDDSKRNAPHDTS